MVKIILAIILIYLKIISIYSAGGDEKSGKNADDKYRKEKSSPLNPNSINRDLSNSTKTNHQFNQLVPYNSHQNDLRKKAMANWIRSKNVQNLHFQEQGDEPQQQMKPRRSSQENVINFGELVQPVGNFGSHEPFTITSGEMNFGRQNSAFPLYKSEDRQEEMKRKQQYFHALDPHDKKQVMEKVLHKLTQTAPSNAQHQNQIISENDQRQSNSTKFRSTIEFAKWLLSSKKSEGLPMPQRHSHSQQSSQQQQLPILDKKRKGILLESEKTNPTAHFRPDNFIQAYPPQHDQSQIAFEALPSNSFSQNEIEKQQRMRKYFDQQHQNDVFDQIGEGANWQGPQRQQHLLDGVIYNQIHLPDQNFMRRAVDHLMKEDIYHPLPDQNLMDKAINHQIHLPDQNLMDKAINHQIHLPDQNLMDKAINHQIHLPDQNLMDKAINHQIHLPDQNLMDKAINHQIHLPDQNLMDKAINHQIHLAHQYDAIAGQHPIAQQQFKPGDFLKTVQEISQKYANYFNQHAENIQKLEKGKGKRLLSSNVAGSDKSS